MISNLLTGPKSELEAIELALSDRMLPRIWEGLRAGIALALDPDDTQQVFYLAIAVDRETLPLTAERLRAYPSGRELLARRPAIDKTHVDFAALRALPATTLGGAYARMLEAKNLDPDLFQRPPGLPDDLAYVAQRARQTHDLWHVLTGLDTDIAGETALQAFTYEQLHQNFSRLIVTFGQLFFGAKYPHMKQLVERARRAGAGTPFLLAVAWEELWTEPLARVREQFRLTEAAADLQQLAAASCKPQSTQNG
jgi:ubiquinone biosynthesis protein COQ4